METIVGQIIMQLKYKITDKEKDYLQYNIIFILNFLFVI